MHMPCSHILSPKSGKQKCCQVSMCPTGLTTYYYSLLLNLMSKMLPSRRVPHRPTRQRLFCWNSRAADESRLLRQRLAREILKSQCFSFLMLNDVLFFCP